MAVTYLPLIDAGLRGAVIALLLLLTVEMARGRARLPSKRVGMLIAIGLCVQVISSAPPFEAQVPRLWQAPFIAVSVANAVLFWMFVQAMFDDDFAIKRLHVTAWLAVATLSGLNCVRFAEGSPLVAEVALGLQRAVPLVFSVLAVIAAVSNWRADLVEARRRLRAVLLVAGVLYTIAVFAMRVGSPGGRLSDLAAVVDVVALLIVVALAVPYLLHPAESALVAATPLTRRAAAEPERQPTTEPDPAEERLSEALQRLMAVEHIYRSENLSVAGLAARLAAPEYRLRRLINQRLGYRNFNAYINAFRLAEARAALADPGRRETPVLTIALGAGFQSIGPFNRAFKTATGRTPTEFRREKLAES
ncbi:MAG TPA: AraC family transcriptional regulator [Burkholderiaceae bacterium]|nr:AraC family transcriptional regulator [Burkholderiaceae bacterium]